MENRLLTSNQHPQLIAALKNHNLEAFGKFYDFYSPVIYRYIKKSLYEVNASEETLQNCFCTMWKLVDQLDASKERLLLWAINIASKEVRKKKIHLMLEKIFDCQQDPLGKKLEIA